MKKNQRNVVMQELLLHVDAFSWVGPSCGAGESNCHIG